MRKKRSNDIKTPRLDVKVGEKVMRGPEPVALVKQGGTKDTMSVSEFAEALYGTGTQCLIIPPPMAKGGKA